MADSPNPIRREEGPDLQRGDCGLGNIEETQDHREQAGALTYRGWIAAHVGKGAFKGDYSARIPNCPSEEFLSQRYMGCIVGLFKIKDCRRPNNCGGSVWAEGPVCNVVEAVIELPSPVPVTKGKLHVWVMDEGTRLTSRGAAGFVAYLVYGSIFITTVRADHRADHAGPESDRTIGQMNRLL